MREAISIIMRLYMSDLPKGSDPKVVCIYDSIVIPNVHSSAS